ncbi:MAG TPA: cob(I)yrinic acid a,c-diamide adenosyltransferase [Myxococcales bacterium]|nr:ATP:cob(I)alamin adenosyltransferase [Deltaproteobacteria bacterium]MBU50727.1 ATP:cob(I)alamin adenosyltransferase [Deltaproteobacteria bacterium]HAA57913.1 cob(I)yrinic acid a,c-diamide adenosyltransferase [Myxococcales bacterium]|tara:strand:- start:1167 stop:1742 length:576 start_codon:yes stop_codon:yes gene_type:complete
MKIYTKKGDKGETGLLGNVRVSKAHIRVDAYGHVDELVSVMGLVRSMTEDQQLSDILGSIQLELFFLSSELATPPGRDVMGEVVEAESIEFMEQEIDRCDEELPPLKSFILPGGSVVASYLQLARTVCRRAERSVVHLAAEESVRPLLVQYLNRLSDLLFALGRRVNFREGIEDVKVSDLREKRLQASVEK